MVGKAGGECCSVMSTEAWTGGDMHIWYVHAIDSSLGFDSAALHSWHYEIYMSFLCSHKLTGLKVLQSPTRTATAFDVDRFCIMAFSQDGWTYRRNISEKRTLRNLLICAEFVWQKYHESTTADEPIQHKLRFLLQTDVPESSVSLGSNKRCSASWMMLSS